MSHKIKCSEDLENIIKLSESKIELNNNKDTLTELPRSVEEESNQLEIVEENLIFNVKFISPLKLYCSISGKVEIFLMIVATILTIGAGCSNALKSSLLGDAINNLASTAETKDLPDDEYEVLMDNVEPQINSTIRKFLIYGSIMFVLNFSGHFLWLYLGLRQMHKLKVDYFSLILRQEQGWFDLNNPYEFASKIQAQFEGIEQGLGERLEIIILRFIEIISGYIVGFQTSWKLTLVQSACAIPFIIAGHFFMRYGIRKQKILSIKKQEKMGGIAEEILYNIKTITSFANFDYEIKRFDKSFESNTKVKIPKTINSGLVQGIVNMGIYLGFTITCIYARSQVESDYDHETVHHLFTAGDVVKVLLSVRKAILSLMEIPPSIMVIRESCASASDYFTLSERASQIYISKDNLKPEKKTIKGKIEFKNVKFSYPDEKGEKVVLKGINLKVEAGQKVALVGDSGCGKSTTVNLIERLYEPTEGEILLDGINIKEYNIEYLRSLIGYVKQKPVLFNSSIKNNIIFGREEQLKELGDGENLLKESCKDAFIKDYIEKKKEKYEFNVGINGDKLLPSQKQRISIARALLLRPKIMILDEATSSLDNEAEKNVILALDLITVLKVK